MIAGHIMVVDDDLDTRDTLVLALELLGQRAVAIDSGAAALRALSAAHDAESPFTLAIVDVGMPDMSGYELVSTIRRGDGGTSLLVVALTGRVSPADRARALDAGFDAHLSKPVDLSDIRELLQWAGARV